MPTLFITSPLEPEYAARMAGLDPRLTVDYQPDLLPVARFPADHGGAPLTRTAEQQARWKAGLAGADILWGVPSAVDGAHATRVQWIQGTSTGVGPAVAKLNRPDLHVTTARGVHARPLAEFVFMALLAHFRGLAALRADQKMHHWRRGCVEEIAGKTLVILGAGDLARGCARIARALDMHVVAVARDPGRDRVHAGLFDEVVASSALHAAMRRADAFVITVPFTPLTDRMVDAAALACLPRGAAFVNIGRGTVVDEAALVAALRSGQVGYAALDVTAVEPLPEDSPLWDMPNVLISPHSASTVSTENAQIVDIFAHNLQLWLDGRRSEMRNVLDQVKLY
ncbi:D-2-hydroxyacid dehydrogenase [Acidisphaera sp. L21]|uniref:D-2-hydroxyacid dehydrogenase n=1 Tax=Acidisphaera sp. L21 TaxID=1641851 RepID=UPI00131BEBA5|nr:D-2-hydroxyacid dehydrogenase [Acidisphaera sp. L21]